MVTRLTASCYCVPMAAERFPEQLRAYLKRRGLSGRAFSALVGCSLHLPDMVMRGARTPPLKDLPAWARHLQLTDAETRAFLIEGLLVHATEEYRAYLQ